MAYKPFLQTTEIRCLRQPESTSTSAAAAPPSGSKTQTDMRAAGAHPMQRRQQLEPLPNTTVGVLKGTTQKMVGNPSSTQPTTSSAGSSAGAEGDRANPVPTCTASPQAPMNAAAQAVVSALSAAAEHPTVSSAEAPAGAWGPDITTQYCWQGGSL